LEGIWKYIEAAGARLGRTNGEDLPDLAYWSSMEVQWAEDFGGSCSPLTQIHFLIELSEFIFIHLTKSIEASF
jgi:hypothetical protein